MTTRTLVVSAVNFTEGGPLTVLRDSLDAAVAALGKDWRIIALVHDRALIANPLVETIAFPESKTSWLRRVTLEWHKFASLSRRLRPDLWLSLHDITPRVSARRQAVYCHNPSPFYSPSLTEAWFDPGFFAFNKLYLRLYRTFIRRNFAVIVQQDWLRNQLGRYHDNVVVAHPASAGHPEAPAGMRPLGRYDQKRPLRLLYPALPRVFKNIETVCEAVVTLPPKIRSSVELRLTMDGSEGRWAQALRKRYDACPSIRFIGRQDQAGMACEYGACDVVVFPSRLETWGLPITEAKSYAKPLMVSDLPYAHEAVGSYPAVDFIAPDDVSAWAKAIMEATQGEWRPASQSGTTPAAPFFPDWSSLWAYLTRGL